MEGLQSLKEWFFQDVLNEYENKIVHAVKDVSPSGPMPEAV